MAEYAIKKVKKEGNVTIGYLSGFDRWNTLINNARLIKFNEKVADDFIKLKRADEDFFYLKEKL